MNDNELVKKLTTYLQSAPANQKLTYEHVAAQIKAPYSVERIKKIITRSDSPYFTATQGGVKTHGQGSAVVKKARRMAIEKERGFFSKLLENDPAQTMRPGLTIEDGEIKLGPNDYLDKRDNLSSFGGSINAGVNNDGPTHMDLAV